MRPLHSYGKGSPGSHCGGEARMFSVKIPDLECATVCHGMRAEYSLSNSIFPDFGKSSGLRRKRRLNGQVYGRVSRGFKTECAASVNLELINGFSCVVAADTNTHVICKLLIENKMLLFVTMKGASNAEPERRTTQEQKKAPLAKTAPKPHTPFQSNRPHPLSTPQQTLPPGSTADAMGSGIAWGLWLAIALSFGFWLWSRLV